MANDRPPSSTYRPRTAAISAAAAALAASEVRSPTPGTGAAAASETSRAAPIHACTVWRHAARSATDTAAVRRPRAGSASAAPAPSSRPAAPSGPPDADAVLGHLGSLRVCFGLPGSDRIPLYVFALLTGTAMQHVRPSEYAAHAASLTQLVAGGESDQRVLLGALEESLGVRQPQLLASFPLALKALYDLDVLDKKGATLLKVAVKGTSSALTKFGLSDDEREGSTREPLWRMLVVSDALTASPTHKIYKPTEVTNASGFEA